MRQMYMLLAAVCITATLIASITTDFLHVQAAQAASSWHLPSAHSGRPHDALSQQQATPNNNGTGLLLYYGGPTMQSTSTNYTIFWEPPALQDGTATHVSPTYNSLIEQYFNDVGGSGLYNNNTQYYDTTGHIVNNSTLGGVWIDTSSYPPSGCADTYTPHGCLNDGQLRAEVVNAMAVNGWSGGTNHAFFVFTAWGEGSCHGDCAFSNFCAFHNYFISNGSPVTYANLPYMGTDLPNCGTKTSPNNDFDADSTINYLSHEHMEIVTDPLLNAWHDLNGNETGDRCGARFGLINLDGGLANEQWNGHYYIVQEEWSNATAGCVQSRALSGTVYVGSDDRHLYALGASDGSFFWSKQTGNTIYSSPTSTKGVVYVGSTDGTVYAYKTSDNSLLWQFTTGGPIYASPRVVKGVVYIGSSDDNLYALNAITGIPIWHFSTGGPIASSPAVVSGIIYVGSNDSYLYAISSKGILNWRYQTGGAIASSPTVHKGVVYVGSNDDYLYSLNASTGGFIWRVPTSGSIGYSSPTVANGAVFIGSSDGSIYAFNAASGASLWSHAMGGQITGSPGFYNGVVYIGSSDGYLYAFNATNGSLVWQYQTGGPIASSPRIIDGVVYVGSNDGSVYALWFNDATLIWRYQIGNSVESSPAVVLSSY